MDSSFSSVARSRPTMGLSAGMVSCCSGTNYCGLWERTHTLAFRNPQHYCPACRGYLHGALCGVTQADDSEVASSTMCFPCFYKMRDENPAAMPLFFNPETLQIYERTGPLVSRRQQQQQVVGDQTSARPLGEEEEVGLLLRETGGLREQEKTAPLVPEQRQPTTAHLLPRNLEASSESREEGGRSLALAEGDPPSTEMEVEPAANSRRTAKAIQKRKSRPQSFWYQLCHTYVTKVQEQGISMTRFLKSDLSGPDVTGTDGELISFTNRMKLYKAGQLQPDANRRRCRKPKYPLIEERLVKYVKLWSEQFKIDKGELSWTLLKQKCLHWCEEVKDPSYRNFQASPGYIDRVLKRHGLQSFKIQGDPSLQGREHPLEEGPLPSRNDPALDAAHTAEPTSVDPIRNGQPVSTLRTAEPKVVARDIRPQDDEDSVKQEPVIDYHTALAHLMDIRQYAVSIGVSAEDMRHFEAFEKVIWRRHSKKKP